MQLRNDLFRVSIPQSFLRLIIFYSISKLLSIILHEVREISL